MKLEQDLRKVGIYKHCHSNVSQKFFKGFRLFSLQTCKVSYTSAATLSQLNLAILRIWIQRRVYSKVSYDRDFVRCYAYFSLGKNRQKL